MRIGFVDNSGSLFSVAWHVKGEGHGVRYVIQEEAEEEKVIGEGLVEHTTLDELIKWNPDAILTYKSSKAAEKLTKAKIPNFGSSQWADKLEDDRLYAANIVKEYSSGVLPDTHKFNSAEEARDFLHESGKRHDWVFKADGAGGVDVSTTHVTKSRDHLLAVLDYEEQRGSKRFVLQQKVEGVEVDIEGWYDYEHGWLMPINSTLERKYLMSGDNGPMSGCMGSIVWPWKGDRPLLFRQTIEHLTPFLEKIKYRGPLSQNNIIDFKSRKPHWLEFTPRLGWNAFEALMYGYIGSIGEFIVNFAKGQAQPMRFRGSYCGAIRVYCPAAPNIPVFAPLREDSRFYPKDLWSTGADDERQLFTVGCEALNGFTPILECCAVGDSVKEVTRELYEDVIPQIEVTDITFRDDIGEQACKDLEMLKNWGYVVE